jgi:hypothetical protein
MHELNFRAGSGWNILILLVSCLQTSLTTKEFFPNIKDRLNTKINLTPNLTAIVTSYGKTKSYLHRFKIIESPDCPCGGGGQTVDHLIYFLCFSDRAS